MGQLKQLNVTFQATEDRLLLRLKTEEAGKAAEFRFWLTRRFVRLLWNALDKVLEAEARINPQVPPEGRDAFLQFQQEAALSQTDFQTPFHDEAAQTPLGTAPLLLHGFQTTKKKDGTHTLLLQTAAGQSIQLNMNAPLLISVRKLLADGVRRAEWDLRLGPAPTGGAFTVEAPRTIN